ncbi:MAG: ATP cone domain-containing protein, partial [Faecalibacillus sp.]
MKIIKRNGVEMEFDETKISNAIIAANKEVVETERLSD